MRVHLATAGPEALAADALLVLVAEDDAVDAAPASLDAALGGLISDLRGRREFRGELGQRLVLPTFGRLAAGRVVLVGLGRRADLDGYRLRNALELAARELRPVAPVVAVLLDRTTVADLELSDDVAPAAQAVRTAVIGIGLGNYASGEFRHDRGEAGTVADCHLLGLEADPRLTAVAEEAAALADATNYARTLQWRPANRLTPAAFAAEAAEAAGRSGLLAEVLEPDRLEALGMGALLGVARGSHEPPRMLVLRYQAGTSDRTLALVGKGITFDAGGISLKPPAHMAAMKTDMSGGAAVIAAMLMLPRLRPPVSVIGLVPMTENLPGGAALKPGDLVTAMNGRTVEVTNTDAEGRLVLADALSYAVSLGATDLVDVATLTYAPRHALGHPASAALTNDPLLLERLQRAAIRASERIWELPIYPEYGFVLRSDIADLKNLEEIAEAGGMAGAIFLREFVDGRPWIHLDIGGSARSELSQLVPIVPSGPTGVMTRTLALLPTMFAGR